jgi:hypothetical protein
MTQDERLAVVADGLGAVRTGAMGIALLLAAGCGGGAAAAPAGGGSEAAGGARSAARDAARSMGLAWLAGSWRTGDGRAAERWQAVGDVLVGIGFGNDGSVTRSFEVMVVHVGGERLVFTARPNGRSAVAFPQEARGERSITFGNPAHDDPKRVEYKLVDGVLVAATEGPSGRQEWRLERSDGAAAPEIERAAEGRGDRAVEASGASAPGDLGFSIGPDERGRSRVTIWRRDPAGGAWRAVFDLLLTG